MPTSPSGSLCPTSADDIRFFTNPEDAKMWLVGKQH